MYFMFPNRNMAAQPREQIPAKDSAMFHISTPTNESSPLLPQPTEFKGNAYISLLIENQDQNAVSTVNGCKIFYYSCY